jgi:hypothetical protein
VPFQVKDSLSVQFTKAPAIAIAGPSGSGKTESAMRLARGYLGPKKKFLIIDTEEKRALYKKARYQPWDWMDFQPPFTPERYVEALEAAKEYDAVIVDSGSHEYSGPGGLQDIQMETLERMSKGNVDRMDALTAPSWKDAKQRHKSKLMSYLIRYPKLLIICLRAEPKVKFVKDDRGKMQIVDAGYVPICEKMFMYEMLVGAMMTADNAGVPQHIKQLEKDLEPIFLAGKQVDEGTGERLAAWAADRREIVPTAMTEEEVAESLKPIANAKTLSELTPAYETACKRANKARDKGAKDRFIAEYNKTKAAIESETI